MGRECEICGNEIPRVNKRFCSRKCYIEVLRSSRKKCETCGNGIPSKNKRFCSVKCYGDSMRGNTKTCEQCGREFHSDNGRFCSRRCWIKSRKGMKLSPETKEKLSKAHSGKKISESTRMKISKTLKGRFGGENHPRWQGDDGSEVAGRQRAQKLFPNPEPCERCGADPEEREICRHHIDGNTLNNSEGNIEFLCHSCHVKEHAKRRKANG